MKYSTPLASYKLFWLFLFPVYIGIFSRCTSSGSERELFQTFERYYEADNNMDESRWDYTSDTLKIWFGHTDAKPTLEYKGAPKDPWDDWNKVMNTRAYYDSIWYNKEEHAIQGLFYEDNDFYDLLGASPNKTMRTYSFDSDNKIRSLRYQIMPEENTLSNKHMAPVYSWAQLYAPEELAIIFPNNKLVPSTENATRWKRLLNMYHDQTSN